MSACLIALLQNDTDHQLIDATGAVIEGADPRDFTHLKVVAGENAAQMQRLFSQR